MTADLLVAGGTVLSRVTGGRRPCLADLDLLVADGRIAALEPAGCIPASAAREVLDARGRLVLPGLVNAHSHSYGQVCRHCLNDDTLEPWLPRAMAYAQGMAAADSALAARLHAADALRHGVTLVLDHARLAPDHLDAAVEAYEASGIRVALAPQIADRTVADSLPVLDPALHAVIATADRWRPHTSGELLELMVALVRRTTGSTHVRPLVGPSTAERCTPELLHGLAAIARDYRLPIHTHLLESPVQRCAGDPLAVLADAGLLGPETTLAHCVHLSSNDRARIAAAGAVVVYNPMSNLATGAGYFDLRATLDASIRVAFGTDAVNCGGNQDLLAAMRVGVTLRRPQQAADVWIRPSAVWPDAMEAAAQALGFGDVAGRLAPGLGADFLVVDPVRAGCYRGPDWLDQLVFCGFGAGLERVYVAGRLVAQDGHPIHLDERVLAADAATAYDRIERATRGGQAVAAGLAAPLRRLRDLADGRVYGGGPHDTPTESI